MSELDSLIANAYASNGKQEEVNKVYLKLLQTDLYIPIVKREIAQTAPAEDDFTPLFAEENDRVFMAAFDELSRLQNWAGEHFEDMDYAVMPGEAVIAGLGPQVYLALNPGAEFYKEFPPEEIQRLKAVVGKLMQWRKPHKPINP